MIQMQRRTAGDGAQTGLRIRSIALGAPLILVLAGCAGAPAADGQGPSAAAQPAVEATAPGGAATEAEAVAGAVAAVEQRFERWSTGDHAGTCELLSDGVAQRIADDAGVQAEGCERILAAVDERTDAVVTEADADGVEILTPYYWMPQSIAVDASLAEADSTSLVHLPNRAITVTDDTAFSDGPAELPGWLEEPAYLRLVDGVWTFILPSER